MRRPRTRSALLLYILLPLIIWPISGWTGLSPLPLNSSQPGLSSSVVRRPSSGLSQPDTIAEILKGVSKEAFLDMVGGLSGAHPVTIGNQPVTLTTRYTPSPQGALAEQYVYEYFQSLGLFTHYESWTGDIRCTDITARNVVAEIPGKSDPSRIYLITSHLDSTSPNPLSSAPGADDDGSGTAAVLLAAKILHSYTFDYTLRFVTFTGEERGLCGSDVYAREARARNDDIRGVINLDMIAYDSNGVKDVEIHAGVRPDSQALAASLSASMAQYSPHLVPHIYKEDATNLSDHASFWASQYPAVVAAEFIFHGDINPYYHSVHCCDTIDHLDLDMATDIMRATLATFATLGGVHAAPVAATVTPVPAQTVPGSNTLLFPETGKRVTGLFLDYWDAHGGLAQQGYPISEPMSEASELDGKTYTVQYFERAVFEYHPEKGAPFNVLLSQLGAFAYGIRYGDPGAPNQKANTTAGSITFPETGMHLGGKFLAYWEAHGGLAQQGYPISDEFQEKSSLDGKTYTVQYFERAVFEYHPENAGKSFEVLLSQLGTFQYKSKYGGKP